MDLIASRYLPDYLFQQQAWNADAIVGGCLKSSQMPCKQFRACRMISLCMNCCFAIEDVESFWADLWMKLFVSTVQEDKLKMAQLLPGGIVISGIGPKENIVLFCAKGLPQSRWEAWSIGEHCTTGGGLPGHCSGFLCLCCQSGCQQRCQSLVKTLQKPGLGGFLGPYMLIWSVARHQALKGS